MNIFVLHDDPAIAASMSCDKHVVKMILETAQMLSTVAHSRGHRAPYKATHKNHPCTLWAGESKANWRWLIAHGLALCSEYTTRYDKVHKSQAAIEWCRDNPVGPDHGVRTPFRLAMPDQYKCDDPVKAYRAYYHGEKSGFAKWAHSPTPTWW
jgi:hypothetical protein